MAANPKYRYFYVVWAFLECLLFGGLLYGWGSLVFVLKEDGVYSELCDGQLEANASPNDSAMTAISNMTVVSGIESLVPAVNYSVVTENSTQTQGVQKLDQEEKENLNLNCPDRDRRLTLVFTIASMMFCAGCALMGQINFKFGTRVTRICALIVFTLGALLTGFTSHELPWLIFPGLSLLGFGGIPLLMTNTQFSMLFTRGSSTVVSMMSGAFDASSGVMLIVKLLHESGMEVRWSMLAVTCFHLLTLVNTFFFLPKGFIVKSVEPPVKEDATDNEVGVELIMKNKSHNEKDMEVEKLSGEEKEKKALPSLKSCVLSPIYLLHVMWLSVLQLRFYYFLGALNAWLTSLLQSHEAVSYYTNVCLYAMMCGLFTSPVAGIIFDFNKRFFVSSRSQLRRDLMPSVIPLSLTCVFGILMSFLMMVDSPSVLYPVFILNTVFRSFMYSMGASYIGVMFPSEYFGILYGIMIILGGVISLAQYGLFSWAEASGFNAVNWFLIVFMLTSLIHPVYQWITCRRAESQVTLED